MELVDGLREKEGWAALLLSKYYFSGLNHLNVSLVKRGSKNLLTAPAAQLYYLSPSLSSEPPESLMHYVAMIIT